MSGIYLAPYGTPPPARLEYERQLAAATSVPPWHLTFDPITPIRQETTVNDLASHSDDYRNCPRCQSGRYAPPTPTPEELTVAETPTTEIQYGTKKDGEVTWPDADNELHFEKKTVDGFSGWIAAYDLPRLQAAAKASGVTLVQRTLTYGVAEEVKPPLPTRSGSVVRVLGGLKSPSGTVYARSAQGTWRRADGSAYVTFERLAASDYEILHDAGAAL